MNKHINSKLFRIYSEMMSLHKQMDDHTAAVIKIQKRMNILKKETDEIQKIMEKEEEEDDGVRRI